MSPVTTFFRIDRKASKWHVLTQVFDGAHSARVLRGACGAMLGDSPDREPHALEVTHVTNQERICAKCRRVL